MVLDRIQVVAERGQHRGLVGVGAERHRQMLVDIGVDRQERGRDTARGSVFSKVPGEERGECGLPAAALANKRSLHSAIGIGFHFRRQANRPNPVVSTRSFAHLDAPRGTRTPATDTAPSRC
jgi:hypothetical protein